MRFIWQHPTAAAPLKVEVFRARILLESLHNGVSSLDTQEVIKSLTMMPCGLSEPVGPCSHPAPQKFESGAKAVAASWPGPPELLLVFARLLHFPQDLEAEDPGHPLQSGKRELAGLSYDLLFGLHGLGRRFSRALISPILAGVWAAAGQD